MRERTAAAVGLFVIAASLIAVLSQSRPQLAATNANTRGASARLIPIGPRAQFCQAGQFVPRDAAAVRLFVAFKRRGPVSVSVRLPNGSTLAGRVGPGYQTGPIELPIVRPRSEARNAIVCVRNEGARSLQLAGNAGRPGVPKDTEGHPSDVIRVDFLRGGKESWWALGPVVARRFPLDKASFFGAWTLWAVAVVLTLVWTAAILLLVRRPSS